MRRRVHDVWSDQYGWAVEHLTHGRYRVEWDNPTPHQDTAKPVIPSKFFVWADTSVADQLRAGGYDHLADATEKADG